MITIFGTFELKLLHPSYIDYLRSRKPEKLNSEVADADKKHFEIIFEVIGAETEKIRLRKTLLYANLVKIEIKGIDYIRITSKGTLEVKAKGVKMAEIKILTNDSKPIQAKTVEKFKSCILRTIKYQETHVTKPLFDVKEEPEDY
ncbi:hypothetical protein QVD17_30870 [Tagetes erecta]|uniref:Uncharacterized protein n=1 Tax=Tagetes erecta TaxID=13708 RepID=A0AAD8NMQ6_TARER|nr:hypothetical protein QVD17_30870 [Tagetes erecta]